jgi:hypothetical protein
MTGLNHGITGAAIALVAKQPVLAIPLSFLSHFATDLVPHFGFDEKYLFKRRFNILLITDFLLSVCLMVALGFIFPSQKWLIWACMIAAASPDLTWSYYKLYLEHIKKVKPIYDPIAKFHHLLQWSQSIPGAVVEAVWLILMGCLIFTLR